jgi:hypothetical protein
MGVLHHCDVRPCCNPAHLFLGTPADNVADMIAKGRKVVVRGRPLPPERRCRGDAHWTRRFPDRVLRGNRSPRGNAKLTFETATAIRAALAAGVAQVELARLHGVSSSTISLVASGKVWS